MEMDSCPTGVLPPHAVIFENDDDAKEVRKDPTTFLPEEPMVYEYKKKKKKKKHKELEDPLKNLDKPLQSSLIEFEPDVAIKVENIEIEVDFSEFANSGFMLDREQEDIKNEQADNNLVCLSFENITSDKSILGYHPSLPINTAPNFVCEICNHVCNSARALKVHIKTRHNALTNAFNYICDYCGMSYDVRNSLVAHIARKHSPDTVPEDKEERVCEICSLMFVGMSRLRMHMKRKHDTYFENFQYKCPVCDLSYDKSRSLAVHMERKHKKKRFSRQVFNCPFCPKLFAIRDTYKKHIRRKHRVSDFSQFNHSDFLQGLGLAETASEITCTRCSLVFSDVNKLKIHMRRKHDAYQEHFSFKCTICNLSYDKMASLKRHIRRKHDRGAYCDLCLKQFDTREMYLNHTHDQEVLECPVCTMIFSNRQTYSKHLRCTHKIGLKDKTFFCKICHDGFWEKRQLRLHLTQKHLKVFYTCAQCNKTFRAKESHRRHVLRTHPVDKLGADHPCNLCNQVFMNEQALSRHIDNAHSKDTDPNMIDDVKSHVKIEKVYQCPKCPESFNSWVKLKTHNTQSHCPAGSSKMQCQCQTCGLVLPAIDLPKHMKQRHTETDYKCPHCTYETTHKANLTKHLLRHSDAVPLKCEAENCKFKTFYASAMQNHKTKHLTGKYKCRLQCSKCPFQSMNKYTMKYHEKQHLTGKKKYSCDQCDYSTLLPANLIQHKYKHSPEKSFKCEVCPFATRYNTSLRYHIKKKHCDLPIVKSLCE